MIKKLLCWMLLLACCWGAASAETYLFPYEGVRFDAQENLRALTQYNLGEQEDFLRSKGLSPDALESHMRAESVFLMIFPTAGNPFELRLETGAEGMSFERMDEGDRAAYLAAFAEMPLYQEAAFSEKYPAWLRLLSSAMEGETPVYRLEYVTRTEGRLYRLTLSKEAAIEEDDLAIAERILERLEIFPEMAGGANTPAPLPTATALPMETPEVPMARQIAQQKGLPLEVTFLPAELNAPDFEVRGSTEPGARVSLMLEDQRLARETADADGAFVLKGNLDQEGTYALRIAATLGEDQAELTYETRYVPVALPLLVLEPIEPTQRSEPELRGQTAPGATVRISGEGATGSYEANGEGIFRFRLSTEKQGDYTYTLKATKKGYLDSEITHTFTREWTYRESLGVFRQSAVEIAYEDLCADPDAYANANVTYRGEVGRIDHQEGLPCLLFFTRSLGRGEWTDPIYVVCPELLPIAALDRLTLYVQITGETREYQDAGGVISRVPVARLSFWSD